MSARRNVPSYRLHKQSGQAIVTLTNGMGGRKDVLLGPYGTPESRSEYLRVVQEWESNGRRLAATINHRQGATVNELVLAYWRFAEGYYVKNGKTTSQLERVKRSLRPVMQLYGHVPVEEFGPLSLKAVRDVMIGQGWVRRHINHCVGCIKRTFKWAVENELAPPSVFHGLQAVAGLKKGRCECPESVPVRPVADTIVDATLPFLSRPLRAVVQLQRLTGMRPGEVLIMRPCDIDRSRGKVWLYRPNSHKTQHHGIERVVFLGPQAQEIVKPFLERDACAYCFSPREAMRGFRQLQRYARKTRVQPSQVSRKKNKPRKQPGDRYLTAAYGQAVANACEKIYGPWPDGVSPHWHPHQLRHNAATTIRREAGIDMARAVLGHSSATMTEIYAEIDSGKAAEIMERIG